jgi:2-hydroxychromene-2-carboxylate isomerase
MATIDFYYSIGSRYSYLASTQMARFEQEGHEVRWRPLNSRALVARRGHDPFAGTPVSGQYEWTYRRQDAERWAAHYGIPFVDPRDRVEFDPELVALAAVAAARLGQGQAYSRELFSAMFAEPDVRRLDRTECIWRAAKQGLAADLFERELEDPATRHAHGATVDSALKAGVFGVPTFIVGGELFWGNDRLVLVRAHLEQRGSS